jgi:hypothetical protein
MDKVSSISGCSTSSTFSLYCLKTYVEAKRIGRPVYIFHLGFPDISCRYNAIGSFTKITEVAGRISDQLPSEGNASTFKDFAWGFVNIVAKALVKAGDKP